MAMDFKKKEWDEYRTSFGGQIDPAFEEFLNEKRTWRLNAWFGQRSLYDKPNKRKDDV